MYDGWFLGPLGNGKLESLKRLPAFRAWFGVALQGLGFRIEV